MFLLPVELIGHAGLKLLVIIGSGERLLRCCSHERLIFWNLSRYRMWMLVAASFRKNWSCQVKWVSLWLNLVLKKVYRSGPFDVGGQGRGCVWRKKLEDAFVPKQLVLWAILPSARPQRGLNGLSQQVGLCMVFVMPCSFSMLWFSVGDLTTRAI